MKVLLISEEASTREKLSFALGSQVSATVTDCANIDFAKKLLTGGKDLDLVVYHQETGDPCEDPEFWVAVGQTPAIVIAPKKHEESLKKAVGNLLGIVNRSHIVEELLGMVIEQIGRGTLKRSEPEHTFCPVKTEILISLSPLKTDVYIRLSKHKFLKLFQSGDDFDFDDLGKYRDQKGVDVLYVTREGADVFLERFKEDLRQRLERDKVDFNVVQKTGEDIHRTIQLITEHVGVTPDLEEITKMQVQATLRSIQYHWRLSAIMKQLKQAGGYIASHSLLLSYVSCLIANKTQWASEYNSHKLCFAAYLHDISLTNQELAQIHSVSEFDARKNEFQEQDYLTMKLHPIRSAERLKQFKYVPHDVDAIILQHHERPDGSGFPRQLKFPQISPLAAIFIVAHELVYYSLKHPQGFRIEDFLDSLVEDFDVGFFGEIIDALYRAESEGTMDLDTD